MHLAVWVVKPSYSTHDKCHIRQACLEECKKALSTRGKAAVESQKEHFVAFLHP